MSYTHNNGWELRKLGQGHPDRLRPVKQGPVPPPPDLPYVCDDCGEPVEATSWTDHKGITRLCCERCTGPISERLD